MEERPAFFIASSSQALPVAQAVQENLTDTFDVEIWNQGAFELGNFNLEALINASKRYDFAIMVLTPDDVTISKELTRASPRDNVVFETGFFISALGRKQAFIIHETNSELKLPSDIDGLCCATYTNPGRGSLTGALGAACSKIKNVAISLSEGSYLHKKYEAENKKKRLITNILRMVCSALTAPLSFTDAKLRAFVFRKEEEKLICSHFWAPYPVAEVVGQLMFVINSETEKQVAVIKAAVKKMVIAAPISMLPEDMDGMEGDVEKDLCFVLAAPILGPYGEVWGTVDFDASSHAGLEILTKNMAENILFELGKHLYTVLSD